MISQEKEEQHTAHLPGVYHHLRPPPCINRQHILRLALPTLILLELQKANKHRSSKKISTKSLLFKWDLINGMKFNTMSLLCSFETESDLAQLVRPPKSSASCYLLGAWVHSRTASKTSQSSLPAEKRLALTTVKRAAFTSAVLFCNRFLILSSEPGRSAILTGLLTGFLSL